MTLAGVDATSSIEDITAGLEGLARTGVGSAERLRVLWNTLGSTKGDNRGAASDPVKAAIDAADFLNQFGAGGQDYSANDPNRAAKLKKLQEQKLEGDITFFELEGLFKDNQIENASFLRTGLTSQDVQDKFKESVTKRIKALNLKVGQELTNVQWQRVYAGAFRDAGISEYYGAPADDPTRGLRGGISLEKGLAKLLVGRMTTLLDQPIRLTGEQLTQAAQETDAAIALTDPGDAFSKQKEQLMLLTLRNLRRHRTDDNQGVADELINDTSTISVSCGSAASSPC